MTTGNLRRGSRPRTAVRKAVLILALAGMAAAGAGAGCSTARQRESPEGPTTLLRFRDPQTYDYFQHVYRTGNLYLDFRPALVVDAIFEDRRFRTLYAEMMREQYFLPAAEAERFRTQQQQEFDTGVSILVFLYEGTNQATPIDRKDSLWKMILRDDDGQLHAPVSITKIKQDHPVYHYIDKYFTGLDRWSRVYRVRFPKLSKVLLGQAVGENPFELILTGVKGTVLLKWEDAGIFYREAKP